MNNYPVSYPLRLVYVIHSYYYQNNSSGLGEHVVDFGRDKNTTKRDALDAEERHQFSLHLRTIRYPRHTTTS